MFTLEICVDSVESAIAAEAGGAHRLELCSALSEGGITPSIGLIESVLAAVKIPVFVMVRPRAGDFCYTSPEITIMQRDTAAVRTLGVDGVVLGLLLSDASVDLERTRDLIELARPLRVTFHRAIDLTPDISESLERIIAAGADRVLTSGGRQTALEGAETITKLVSASKQRIAIMAGGGVRQNNIFSIAAATGATEFHAAPRKRLESPMTYRRQNLSLGAPASEEYARFTVNTGDVRAMRDALDALGPRGRFSPGEPSSHQY